MSPLASNKRWYLRPRLRYDAGFCVLPEQPTVGELLPSDGDGGRCRDGDACGGGCAGVRLKSLPLDTSVAPLANSKLLVAPCALLKHATWHGGIGLQHWAATSVGVGAPAEPFASVRFSRQSSN